MFSKPFTALRWQFAVPNSNLEDPGACSKPATLLEDVKDPLWVAVL
jgi:hypothetical protein